MKCVYLSSSSTFSIVRGVVVLCSVLCVYDHFVWRLFMSDVDLGTKQINFQPNSVSIVHIKKVWTNLFIISIQLFVYQKRFQAHTGSNVELRRQNLLFAKNIPFPFEVISRVPSKSSIPSAFCPLITHMSVLMVNISRVFA